MLRLILFEDSDKSIFFRLRRVCKKIKYTCTLIIINTVDKYFVSVILIYCRIYVIRSRVMKCVILIPLKFFSVSPPQLGQQLLVVIIPVRLVSTDECVTITLHYFVYFF